MNYVRNPFKATAVNISLIFVLVLVAVTVAMALRSSGKAHADGPVYTATGQITVNGDPGTGSLIRFENGSSIQYSNTDVNGYYAENNLANGDYRYVFNYFGDQNIAETDFASESPVISVNGSDVTRDVRFNIPMSPLTVTVKDASGNLVSGDLVDVNEGSYIATDQAGVSYHTHNNGGGNTGSDGTWSINVIDNVAYLVCDGTVNYCTYVTVHGPTSMTLYLPGGTPVLPAAPTNLSAPTSTDQCPYLTWDADPGATFYNIYRNGMLIDTIVANNATAYTDCNAPEGTNNYYVTGMNDAGETGPSNTVSVVYDLTPPTLSMPTWSVNPLAQGQNTTMSVTATDSGSGVGSVFYSVNSGASQPMTYNATTNSWQATFGSNLIAGTDNIVVSATDAAGNSASVSDVLAVYNASNGYVTGHADLAPTANDTMPIPLDTSKNPAKLVLGFTNVTAPASGSFSADYKVKNNYETFSLASTGINWVVIQDSTHASILGSANLTVYQNGLETVTSNIPVRIDMSLGTNGALGTVTLSIYGAGANPSTDSPTYVVTDNYSTNSNVMIHP